MQEDLSEHCRRVRRCRQVRRCSETPGHCSPVTRCSLTLETAVRQLTVLRASAMGRSPHEPVRGVTLRLFSRRGTRNTRCSGINPISDTPRVKCCRLVKYCQLCCRHRWNAGQLGGRCSGERRERTKKRKPVERRQHLGFRSFYKLSRDE